MLLLRRVAVRVESKCHWSLLAVDRRIRVSENDGERLTKEVPVRGRRPVPSLAVAAAGPKQIERSSAAKKAADVVARTMSWNERRKRTLGHCCNVKEKHIQVKLLLFFLKKCFVFEKKSVFFKIKHCFKGKTH